MHLFTLLKQKLRRHRIVTIDEDLLPIENLPELDQDSLAERQFRAIQALSAMRSLSCESTSDLSSIIDGRQSLDSSLALAENERRVIATRALAEMLALGCITVSDLTTLICAEPI